MGWSGKLINLRHLRIWTVRQTYFLNMYKHKGIEIGLIGDWVIAAFTNMSYSSLPAEAVFSAFRSIVYISY